MKPADKKNEIFCRCYKRSSFILKKSYIKKIKRQSSLSSSLQLILIAAVFIFMIPIFNITAEARERKSENQFEIGAWQSELAGSIGFAEKGFDLKSDFKKNADFSKERSTLFSYAYNAGYYSDVYLRGGMIKNYSLIKAYAANNVLINNVAFGAGGVSNIFADMRFSETELLIARELAATDRNGFIDMLYGAKYIRFSLDLTDRDFKMSNNYLRKLVIPVAGVHTQCKIDDKFKLYMWLYGGAVKTGNGADAKNYKTADIEAGIEYHFTPREPDYVEIGPEIKQNPMQLTSKAEWYLKLGYKERYFRETTGANVIKAGHRGPEIKLTARF